MNAATRELLLETLREVEPTPAQRAELAERIERQKTRLGRHLQHLAALRHSADTLEQIARTLSWSTPLRPLLTDIREAVLQRIDRENREHEISREIFDLEARLDRLEREQIRLDEARGMAR